MQVLHVNRRAITLTSVLGPPKPRGQQPNNPTVVLPPTLTNLAGEILRVLRSRKEMSDKGPFEIQHLANDSGKPVFIRGFGVPSPNGVQHARIVLLLTETSANLLENNEIPPSRL
jgi:hypothetical protein